MGDLPLEATPIPWKSVLPVYLLTFAEDVNSYAIFSYVGFLVYDILPEVQGDPTKMGFYGGLLGAIYFGANFLSCFFWGKFSDRYGRKPVLIVGSSSAAICSLLMGFVLDFKLALSIRFFAGLMNGNLGATKSVLGEISDGTNQITLFSLWTVAEGIAGVFGALIGGYLCRPATQYPDHFSSDGFFAHYPYFLVNLTTSLCYFVSVVGCILYMPESLANPTPICGRKEDLEDDEKETPKNKQKYIKMDLNVQTNLVSSDESSSEEDTKLTMSDLELEDPNSPQNYFSRARDICKNWVKV
eukprot:TRINITY_DN1787_c0_g1_i2.p1 TRINITY_DN1787_c0_g1~~TRINITY_DN1787_c0_g1_i2.p1  ORF type:complete len:299 (-),score=43.41 TRINITY_DN1787_c0_g1_i2:907-1803(-)